MSTRSPEVEQRAPTLVHGRDSVLLGALSWAFFLWLSARHDYLGNLSDGAIYLVMADTLSPWHAASPGAGLWLFQNYSFPPLYPLLLALFGGGSAQAATSYAVGASMMALAVVAVHAWSMRLLADRVAAAGVALVFALLPPNLVVAMGIQSEPLYVALSFGGMALFDGPARSRARPWAALLIGCAALARTAGIALIAAAMYRLWRLRRPAAVNVVSLVGLLGPVALWSLVRWSYDMNADYLDFLEGPSLPAYLDALNVIVRNNIAAMGDAVVESSGGGSYAGANAVALALLSLAVVTWLRRLSHGECDACYVLFSLVLLLPWPFAEHMGRFLLVLMPLLLVYACLGAALLGRMWRVSAGRPAMVAVMLAAGAVNAPTSSAIVHRVHAADARGMTSLARAPQWHAAQGSAQAAAALVKLTSVFDSMAAIAEFVPSEACVASTAFAYVPLYGQRRAQPLPRASASDEALSASLHECPYVFMMAVAQWPSSGYPPMYPHARIANRIEVLAVRLWDAQADHGAVLTMLARIKTGQAVAR